MPFDRRFMLVDNGPDIPPELYDTKSDLRDNANLRKHPDPRQRLKRMLAEARAWVKEDAVPLMKRQGGAEEG